MTTDLPADIANALPSKPQRDRFIEFVDLMRVLADCVIANDYTISDELNTAIQLTPAGDQIFTRAVTAKTDRIPPKEARLLCALAIGQEELFIDLERTDLVALATAISAQVKEGEVRFPYEFGRKSYDVYAEMFEEGQAVLTYSETQKFLDATPAGVQQYGRFVTGPYGLHRSRSTRQVHSGRRIQAFHCSDPMCDMVHRVHLSTSDVAAVNAHRDRFNTLLGDDDKKTRDWFGAADEIRDVPAILFSDAHVGVAATLIGDGLSVDELRALVAYLLDATSGELRADVGEFLHAGPAAEAVADLTHAQLMQIALLAREPSLREALDALVESGQVAVPTGEVRRPVVNRERRSGAFGLMPEIGVHGLRFASHDEGFAMLRLRHEVGSLTNLEQGDEAEELTWQIRDIEGETLAEQLDTFFRVTDPAECIQRLVLPRKAHVTKLAKRLGVLHGLDGSDEELVSRFLWKLGYPLHDEEDPRAEFWRLHQRLSGLAKASHTPGSRETEEFLGTASKFFRELERYLAESLAFSAWALLHDHTNDPNPYEYGLEADHARGMSFVQDAADEAADPVMSFDYLSDKLDLYTLIRGFEFLAKSLIALETRSDDYLRSEADVPAYARGSELKRFPFRYSVPFLNLTPRSRERTAEQLREIARSLQRGKVTDIRNEHQHYRKTASGVEQIESALREIEVSLRTLESAGLSLVEFRLEDAIHDRWGRSEYYFAAPRGARHVVTRPSGYDWLGLPELDLPQYVTPGAVFAEPNEVLRFRRRIDSPYTQLWANYPVRRRSRSSALSQSGVEHAGAEVRNT
ncbi:hypothetical protein [Microbacterium aerolatum]|uniref:hypothetical protein n=1 Tax=Microbacterium aerolatum TaxID=153731 RepID=UPI00385034E3